MPGTNTGPPYKFPSLASDGSPPSFALMQVKMRNYRGKTPFLQRRWFVQGVGMARYFFHLYNDVDTIDEDGTDCLDDRAAVAKARAEAVAMAAASITAHRHLVLSHNVRVLDEVGREVATVRFGDVVTVKD